MALEEFGCVLLGDEPAGLWLLKRLKELAPEARFAWVSFDETEVSPKVCVPVSSGLVTPDPKDVFHAEIVTPTRTLTWSMDSIRAAFPEISTGKDARVSASSIRYAIRHRPELLAYAQGLWKYLGRSQMLHPETVVQGALSCAGLTMWDPAAALPADIARIKISPRGNPLEAIQVLKNAGTSITFKGRDPMVAKRWIVAAKWNRLLNLSRENDDLLATLGISNEIRSAHSLVGLKIKVEKEGIPCGIKPLTVLFDTDEVPDYDAEVWPLTIAPLEDGNVELTLWTSTPRELSLDATLDRFRRGVGRLNRQLPFLAASILSYSVPLSMESCSGDDARERALEALEENLIEPYDLTTIHTGTRLQGVTAILPSYGCQFPYPLGPLAAAKKVLVEIVGKKRLKLAEAVSAGLTQGGG